MRDPRLEAAYLATDYVVNDPDGRFVIRIGEVADVDTNCWAFISACNPRSVPLPDSENAERMQRLERDVALAGHVFLYGEGVSRTGDWPAEPSLLILGFEEAEALELAAKYGQAAIVVGERGQPARLVWSENGSA